MTKPFKPPRVLLLVTVTLLVIVSFSVFFTKKELPASIPIITRGQPTLGYAKSRVQVVVFEEPKCSHCGEFTHDVFPELKKDFIDTYKITYTVIPVSFLPGSMPAAIATLCVYYQNALYPNEELFFKYIDQMYRYQGKGELTVEKLLEFAKETSPAINLDKLKKGIENEKYREQIEKNTAYGGQIMDGTISTPTVYVNGIKADDLSYEGMSKLIKEVLEHEGVY